MPNNAIVNNGDHKYILLFIAEECIADNALFVRSNASYLASIMEGELGEHDS